MLHNKKISQRRVLLFDHIGGDGFRTMPSTDSDHPLISGRHAIGTSGRHPSERVDGMLRNRWSAWAGLCNINRNVTLGVHGIANDHFSPQIQYLHQFGSGHNLIFFAFNLNLHQD